VKYKYQSCEWRELNFRLIMPLLLLLRPPSTCATSLFSHCNVCSYIFSKTPTSG